MLARHLAWLATGPPDVGNLTRKVLTGWRDAVSEDPARDYVEQRGPEVSAGNGSVMYCAPLGVVRAFAAERLLIEAPALSALTHWDERCRTACLAVTLAVAGLVRGEAVETAILAAVDAVATARAARSSSTSPPRQAARRPIDGPDMGFTLFTAGVALRVAAEAPSVEAGLREVVAFGGDTDTNAAVAGALLGARFGRTGCPAEWLARLADREAIEAEAEALASLLG